jgi:hypothetical protein
MHLEGYFLLIKMIYLADSSRNGTTKTEKPLEKNV